MSYLVIYFALFLLILFSRTGHFRTLDVALTDLSQIKYKVERQKMHEMLETNVTMDSDECDPPQNMVC